MSATVPGCLVNGFVNATRQSCPHLGPTRHKQRRAKRHADLRKPSCAYLGLTNEIGPPVKRANQAAPQPVPAQRLFLAPAVLPLYPLVSYRGQLRPGRRRVRRVYRPAPLPLKAHFSCKEPKRACNQRQPRPPDTLPAWSALRAGPGGTRSSTQCRRRHDPLPARTAPAPGGPGAPGPALRPVRGGSGPFRSPGPSLPSASSGP